MTDTIEEVRSVSIFQAEEYAKDKLLRRNGFSSEEHVRSAGYILNHVHESDGPKVKFVLIRIVDEESIIL